MLPKKNRLTKKEDFEAVYRKGRSVAIKGGNFSLKFLRNDTDRIRIGVSIGKSFSQQAVKRNRARRILREALYRNIKNLKSGLDIILFYKKNRNESEELETDSMIKEIKKILIENKLTKK